VNTDALIELLGAPDGRLPGLAALVQARRQAVSLAYAEVEPSGLDPLVVTPVHPLLLCTSIAKAVLGDEDGFATVEGYSRGELVPGLEDRLVTLDGGADVRLLDLEAALLDNLMILSTELAGFRPGLSTVLVRNIIRELVETTFGPDLETSIHGVRWATWLLANPPLTVAALAPEMQSALLFQYGFTHNSAFHNATTREEENLNAARAAFNDGLAGRADADALDRLKAGHDLALRRVERARLFYWWNPTEIDAHAVSDRAALEFERARAGSEDG
jgi:hypothetical protein